MTTIPTRTEPPIELDAFLARCLGRVDLMECMLTSFRAGIHADCQQLQEAVASRDLERIAQLAHKVKGASATVAAKPLSQIAAQFEDVARFGDPNQISDCATELFHELDRVERMIASVAGTEASQSEEEVAS
ncbi:MAG: Hpt domain-containing protein [Planctomycetota bacterium]|nr:MAG: Hpt domain-containing protein [Planctomycetota bacterium]